jgi:hypothetical protein
MTYSNEDLLAAERHVAKGEEHVARQETIIAKLQAEGADTTLAQELLAEFYATLQDHRDDRDKIAAQLTRPA